MPRSRSSARPTSRSSATNANGDFNSSWVGGSNCYKMAGNLQTGQRVLTTGWGCEDQQFVRGDCTESANPATCTEDGAGGDEYFPPRYKAKYYPLQRFYDRYGFLKGTGGGFAFNLLGGERRSDHDHAR